MKKKNEKKEKKKSIGSFLYEDTELNFEGISA